MPTIPSYMPQGIVHVGKVPFDNTYAHTVLMNWATADTMAAAFIAKLGNTFDNNTYTYIRANNSIRVNYNAELLYGCNYCVYQNANYSIDSIGTKKWYYAFITEVNYINESCTELVLEIDVIHTYWFDINLEQCFVEREHVASDEVGEHIIPEPEMPMEYEYMDFKPNNMQPAYIVFQTTAFPRYKNANYQSIFRDNGAIGAIAVPSKTTLNKYQNYITASQYVIYKYADSNSITAMMKDLDWLNRVGAGDAIIDAFLIPSSCVEFASDIVDLQIDTGVGEYVTVPDAYMLRDGAAVPHYDIPITPPTGFRNYQPKNNKMLIYPYSFLEFGDYSGRTQEYRYEFFQKDNSGNVHLTDKRVISGDCTGYITPKYYCNVIDDPDQHDLADYSYKPFTYDYTNKISWKYGTFENWAAQNQLGNTISMVVGAIGIGGGLVAEIAGSNPANNVASIGQSASNQATRMAVAGATNQNHLGGNRNLRAAAGVFNNSAIGAGIMAIGSTLASIDRAKHRPNEARGNTAGNAKFQCDYSGFYYAKKRLRPEFAKIIDDFFTMYGYTVATIKVPEIFSRVGWNYVKCVNSDHYGNVPDAFLSIFNQIFNTGITFWHSWNVGDYSVSNSIVTPI